MSCDRAGALGHQAVEVPFATLIIVVGLVTSLLIVLVRVSLHMR